MPVDSPSHIVAVLGGACAGSSCAEILAAAGAQVVVIEQNKRPYGKIEDGLPRWHDKQRMKEYSKINARLSSPGVTFVPLTKLGRDIDFKEFSSDWGWSAVILANGAWNDRPLPAANAELAVGHGLVYQNPFIHWFNHYEESDFSGTRYEVPEGAICVGGGLASIDVVKVFQLETYARALRKLGHEVDILAMEHAGIPKYCAKLGIEDPGSLGVKNCTLVYRRRIEDMPLASASPGASEKQIAGLPLVRTKMLGKSKDKYLFDVSPTTMPTEVVMEDGRVTGLQTIDTEVLNGRATPVEGSEKFMPASFIVSSIGSIPEPIDGIEMDGPFYHFRDAETGIYDPLPGVFGTGNVVTGQGNIKISQAHSEKIARQLIDNYLGVGQEGERDISAGFARSESTGAATAASVQNHLERVSPQPQEVVNGILDRIASRQHEVGYDGDYMAWIASVSPADPS